MHAEVCDPRALDQWHKFANQSPPPTAPLISQLRLYAVVESVLAVVVVLVVLVLLVLLPVLC